jgi:glycosyltransferase involved in cell wall biosynthesis
VRILYLHQYFNTPDMGGGTRSYEMGRRFVAWGHSVEMVTTDRQPAGRRGWYMTESGGMRVHWLPVPYSNRMSFPRRIVSFLAYAIRSAIHAIFLDADIVFATSTPLTVAIPARLVARIKRIPLVFEVRDLWPEVPIEVGALRNTLSILAARWLERSTYMRSTYVVALSPGMADGVEATGYPRARIVVAPNSCDIGSFARDSSSIRAYRDSYPWLGDRPLVAYTGTLGYANEVTFLVEVAAEMLSLNPAVRFLIVGDGSEYDAIVASAREKGVFENNLFITKKIPKRAIVDVICSADLLLSLFRKLPSLEANSANKFFDALAAGKPIAINYGGWQANILRETGAGIILEREPAMAAAEILRFLTDKESLAKAGTAASLLAHERFNRDTISRIVEGTLNNAVRSRGRGK